MFTTAGDSFAAAFNRASDAIDAAVAVQAGLAEAQWPGPVLHVRIGLHLGEAEERGGDYFGPVVNTTARVAAGGHGGQTLITDAVRVAARRSGVTDLGVQRLRDVDEPVHLFQIGDATFPALRVVQSSPSTNLPIRPTRLIGRVDEKARIRQLLLTGRVVTIAAVGGSGKTRLAVAVGEEELPHRRDGVWFVDLTATMNGDDVPAAIAAAVGLQLTAAGPTGQVVRFLGDKAALVILDNCEHLVDACAEFVETLLSNPGDTVVLATSREALDVDGEHVVHLPSLTSSRSRAGISAAVQLFIERATSIDPDFTVDDDVTTTIAILCDRLDGMPLAIELAASRVTVMSPAELIAGLDDRFQLLSGGRRRQRQRTLEATLDWSYQLLDPEQQRVFRTLGVFIGGFDLDAVAAVAKLGRADAVNTVESLVAKSLVVRSNAGSSTRFTLLETLRAYAEDRLAQTDEAVKVRDSHADYFRALASAGGRRMVADIRLGVRLAPDRSNLTAAFDWLTAAGHWIPAGELLLGSLSAYDAHGYGREGRDLFDRCAGPLDEFDTELAAFLRSAIWGSFVMLAEFVRARKTAESLVSSSDPRFRAFGYVCLAFNSASTSRVDAAELLASGRQQLETAKSERPGLNTEIVATFLSSMDGYVRVYGGDLRGALVAFGQIQDMLAVHDHLSMTDTTPRQTEAFCHLLLGNADKTFTLIDWVDSYPNLFGRLREVRALAHLALGQVETATVHIREQCAEAITGRVPGACNDSVLILAALAHSESNHDKAVELLMHTGLGRSPGSTAYARELARRLGIREADTAFEREWRSEEGQRIHGPMGMSTAMQTLRAELTRRGWN